MVSGIRALLRARARVTRMASHHSSELGDELFEDVRYSRLAAIATAHTKNKKTYDNVVSAVHSA